MTIPALKGLNQRPLAFNALDMRYYLKPRACIEICMPPMFAHLTEAADLSTLRQQGIAPVVFLVDLHYTPRPLAFGRAVETRHQMQLYQYRPAGEETSRLLLDMRCTIQAEFQSGPFNPLGGLSRGGPLEMAGQYQALQVITRPLAPRDQRHFDQPPPQLEHLTIHPWKQPYPNRETLLTPPQDWQIATPPQQLPPQLWGYPNTDINQHVNMEEYLMQFENLYAHCLNAGRLPQETHTITRAQVLFSRPFFPGERGQARGQLWKNATQTLLIASIHALDATGEPLPQPSLSARWEGMMLSNNA